MDAWAVACLDCEWENYSADEPSLRHSATVHTWLCEGHTCGQVVFVPGGWIR